MTNDDIVTRLQKCQHELLACSDCWEYAGLSWDGIGLCDDCNGRGYFEICSKCGEPMGKARRKWKREQKAKQND